MNVMTLVEALTCPDGGTWQPFNQVFTLHVCFTEGIGSFPVILLRDGIGHVSVDEASYRPLSTLPDPILIQHKFHIRCQDGIYFEHR